MFRRAATTSVALVLLGSLQAGAQQTYPLTGADVAVYNLVGELTLERATGAQVQVEVRPGGGDANQLKVETTTIRGKPAVRVVYPDDDIVYPRMGRHSNSEFSINEDGTWGNRGPHDRRIRVRGSGSGLEAYADITVRIPVGQKIAVFLGVGQVQANNIDGQIRVDAASGDVLVTKVAGTIYLETGSGNVEATEATGSLTIETGSGDVRLTTFNGTVLDVETGSGNVTGNALTAPRLRVETGSGDITLTAAAAADVNLDAGSGNVDIALTGDVTTLDAETGSGDVTLRLSESTGAEVHLETGSGDMRVDFPVQLVKKEEGTFIGRMGDGKGRIDVETGSGNVVLRH